MNHRSLLLHCAALLNDHADFEAPPSTTADRSGSHAARPTDDETGIEDECTKLRVRGEEEMLSEYLEKHEIVDETDRLFLTEVLHGCIRHQQIIKASLRLFYRSCGGIFLRSDYNLFSALTYLALYRIEELTFPTFGHFVNAVNSPAKTHRFVEFLFSSSSPSEEDPSSRPSLRSEWCKILDADFVNETLVKPMSQWIDQARVLLQELKDKADCGMVTTKSTKEPTKPEPFLLTKPRPRLLPNPRPIPTIPKPRPVPKSTYAPPEMEVRHTMGNSGKSKREGNTTEERSDAFFRSVSSSDPISKDTESPSNTAVSVSIPDPVLREKSRREGTDSRPKSASKAKAAVSGRSASSPTPPHPVKLTVGAILREDALLRKRREEDARRVADAEVLMRDGREFGKWKEDMRAKDEEHHRFEAERRRLEIQLIHEEAIAARDELFEENCQIAQEKKALAAALKQTAELDIKELEEKNAKKIEEAQASYARAMEAKKKVTVENQKIVEALQNESAQMREQVVREAEEERARKAELIRQIRLLETMPLPKEKVVDLTQTAGVGLLTEMSIIELHARLSLVKNRIAEEEAERRKSILEQRKAQAETIAAKLNAIREHRSLSERNRNRSESRSASFSPPLSTSLLLSLDDHLPSSAKLKSATATHFDDGTGYKGGLGQSKLKQVVSLKEKIMAKKQARFAHRQMQKKTGFFPCFPMSKSNEPYTIPVQSVPKYSSSSLPSSAEKNRTGGKWSELDSAEQRVRSRRK